EEAVRLVRPGVHGAGPVRHGERRPVQDADHLCGHARPPSPRRDAHVGPLLLQPRGLRRGPATSAARSFPDERLPGPQLRLQRLRVPSRRIACNELPALTASLPRSVGCRSRLLTSLPPHRLNSRTARVCAVALAALPERALTISE